MRKVVQVEFSQQRIKTGDDKANINIAAGDRIGDRMTSCEGDNEEPCDTKKITGKIHDADFVKRVSYK